MNHQPDFKILLIEPYDRIDILNYNIDVRVVLPTGEVYFATLFTIANINMLLEQSDEGYLSLIDMIIVKELTIPTIRFVIKNIINDNLMDVVMSKVGLMSDIFPEVTSYDMLKDFSCPLYGFI